MAEKIPSNDVKMLSFDLWLTLLRTNGPEFRNARNEQFRRAMAPDMSLDDFNTLVRFADDKANLDAEETGVELDFYDRANRVSAALGKTALPREVLAGIYDSQVELLAAYPPVLIDPETPELLASCKNSVKLAVVSNTGFIHGEQMRGVLNRVGILDSFDHLMFSNEVGFAKPDKRMYGALLDTSGVAPEAVVHFGDNLNADVRGAQSMGMQAVHLPLGSKITDVLASPAE